MLSLDSVDLVVVPMLLRGLFERNIETMQAEIGPHVARSVAFFVAGCGLIAFQAKWIRRRRPRV